MGLNYLNFVYIFRGKQYNNRFLIYLCTLYSNTTFDGNKAPVLLCKRQTEENVNASVVLLISRRMREGYVVDVS